jgi:hypothetical protein
VCSGAGQTAAGDVRRHAVVRHGPPTWTRLLARLGGARLTHAHLGHPIRPGRALLNPGDGTLITVTIPTR